MSAEETTAAARALRRWIRVRTAGSWGSRPAAMPASVDIPLAATIAQLVIAIVGGWLLGSWAVFGLLASPAALYAGITACAVAHWHDRLAPKGP